MPLMGQREYARHRGCALRSVQKAIQSGRITVTDSGKIDSEASDASWQLHTDQAKRSVFFEPKHTVAGLERDNSHAVPQHSRANDAEISRVIKADRARLEKARADKAELEVRQMLGELVDVAEVARVHFTAGRITRDRVEMVAPRAASEIHALVIGAVPAEYRASVAERIDMDTVERRIYELLREALGEAAKAIENADRDDDGAD